MEQHIGYLLKTITDKLKVKADADLKSHGLTLAQSRILVFLHDKGGTATQKEIEDHLEVAHPTVVGVVSRMEQNGFVSSWLDPKDKRQKLVRVTEKAEAIGLDMESMMLENERNLIAGLAPEQVETLITALRTIYNNLE